MVAQYACESPVSRRRRSNSTTVWASGWQAPGADLAHMDATEVAIFIEPQQLVRGILVNARGQRYVAEDTYPGRIGQLTLYHQDDTAYLIIDGDAQEQAMAAPSPHLMMRPPTSVCETVAELETEIGLPPVRCRPRSTTTTPVRPAARIRCCTRRPSGCGRSGPRWVPSTCATAPVGSPSAAWPPRCPVRCCTSAASRSPACSPPAGAPLAWPPGGYASGVSLGDGSFGRRAGRTAAGAQVAPRPGGSARTIICIPARMTDSKVVMSASCTQ